MQKIILILLLQLLSMASFSQQEIETFTDSRDGSTYEVIQIENLYWFRDNLNFETDFSHCPNFSEMNSDCADGNFYSYKELEYVCPDNWRIPTDIEFEDYFKYRILEQNGTISDIVIDTLQRDNLSINFVDSKEKINLLSEPNPLKLNNPGWVEGAKMIESRTVSFWIRHSHIEDDKFHLHITNKNYILHTHDSYIDDVPEKSRKLKVKCVSSVH